MSTALKSGIERLRELRQRAVTYWAGCTARERMLLASGIAVVLAGLLYALLIDPALSGRKKLEQGLPVLRQQVAFMQALSKDAAALSGKAATPAATASKQGIEAALAGKGLRAQNLVVGADMVRLQLSSASFPALLACIDEMQKTMRMTVVEADIRALPQEGMVDATLSLRQSGRE